MIRIWMKKQLCRVIYPYPVTMFPRFCCGKKNPATRCGARFSGAVTGSAHPPRRGARVGVAAAVGEWRGSHNKGHRQGGKHFRPLCKPDHTLGISVTRGSRTPFNLARIAISYCERNGEGGQSAVGGADEVCI